MDLFGSKLDKDFIVDDDGFGYADKGGEIWEYEEPNPKNQDSKNRRVRKTDVSLFSFLNMSSSI